MLGANPALTLAGGIYLEGSDQHRGWFHSSLLVGLGTRQRAPYDASSRTASRRRRRPQDVEVAGQHGRAADVIKQHGAEILRLWAAMVDYREEVRLGRRSWTASSRRTASSGTRCVSSSRTSTTSIRHAIGAARAHAGGRSLALARYAAAATRAREAYDAFDFQAIVHTITHLATVDISAFYSTCRRTASIPSVRPRPRRSAQTAMYVMVEGLVRLLAPILPITADELWQALPGTREASVHLALLPADVDTWRDEALVERWTRLIAVRDVVNGALEAQRQAKTIGTSLEAKVVLAARGETLALLRESAPQLDAVHRLGDGGAGAGAGAPELGVEVVRSDGTKCVRCWRYVHDITTEPAFAGLCSRCVEAVAELV